MTEITRFETSSGIDVYRIKLDVFFKYIGYAHVIVHGGQTILIDVGSGFGSCTQQLLDGLMAIRDKHDVVITLDTLSMIVITHGHIDHFGGLHQMYEKAPHVPIVCHELTRPVLVAFEERSLLSSKGTEDFLSMAGVPPDRAENLLKMHAMGKEGLRSVPVTRVVVNGEMLTDAIRVVHVPGHAPGLIMLQVEDILLTSDHILPQTSVALAPEYITPYTGIGHYIDSLEKALALEGVRLALGGHEDPMADYYRVAKETLNSARSKIDRVLGWCDKPRSIFEIATKIYGELAGYGELLRLWQTGARIEYLNQRGLVVVENLEDLREAHSPTLYYRRLAQ